MTHQGSYSRDDGYEIKTTVLVSGKIIIIINQLQYTEKLV